MIHPRLAFFFFFMQREEFFSMGGMTCRSVGVLGRNQQCSVWTLWPELGAPKTNKTPPANSNYAIICDERFVRLSTPPGTLIVGGFTSGFWETEGTKWRLMFNSLKTANCCQNGKALWKDFALSRDWIMKWEVKSSINMCEVMHIVWNVYARNLHGEIYWNQTELLLSQRKD